MRHRTAYLSLAASLALLATGCSESDDPQVLPTLTATASPTSMSSSVPSAARQMTAAGAAAFARFFYDEVNRAYAIADAGPIRALSDSECSTCSNFAGAVQSLADKQQHLQGLAVRVLTAEAPPEQDGLVAVSVTADAPPRQVLAADGSVVDRGVAEPPYRLTVFVKRSADGWRIRAVQRVKS